MNERILSPSEINCFRNCRQQWVYSYIERRPRTRSGPSRRIGTIVHAGLAAWYGLADLPTCYKTLKAVGKKQEASADEIKKSIGIFEHYIGHYANDLKEYKPIIIEKKIIAPKVGLKAIPDLLTLHLASGLHIVIDHKVQASLDIKKTFDTQKIALFKVMSEEYQVDGIMYNLLRSSLPLIPEPLKNNTRLKKFEGKATTEAIFYKALNMYGFKAQDYPEVVDYFKKNDNPFFKRVYVSISKEEINEFEVEVSTVRDQIASGIIYRNRQWDCERNCDYYDDCFKADSNSDKVLVKRLLEGGV